MEKAMKLFNNYVKQFDFNNPKIRYKFHHSYRVMEIAKEIALSLNLNDEDSYIVTLAALLHDIGRFNQIKNYDTYLDQISTDHGNEGERVLKENDFIKQFVLDEKIINIILNSTKYHNKYEIDPNLDQKTTLICKIVRDADKLDIMTELGNIITLKEIILKKELVDAIYKEEICKNKNCNNEVDTIIRILSWVYDLNFKYSFDYLMKNKIIEKKFNLLEMYGETEEITKIKKLIYKKINEKLEDNYGNN